MALIGHTDCVDPACKASGIAVHKTTGGKVYAACHRCELTQQPKLGSAAHRRLLARMVPCDDDAAPAKPAKPAPDDAPAPAPAKKAAGFQLGAL